MLTFDTSTKTGLPAKPQQHSAHSLWRVQHPKIQQILGGTSLQPKLTIGAPNDKNEREADRVADQVMRMPEQIQRQESPEEEEEDLLQTKQLSSLVQQQELGEEEDELLQTKKAGNSSLEVTPAISAGSRSLQGGGRPMSGSERSFFEPRFGADFSGVGCIVICGQPA